MKSILFFFFIFSILFSATERVSILPPLESLSRAVGSMTKRRARGPMFPPMATDMRETSFVDL